MIRAAAALVAAFAALAPVRAAEPVRIGVLRIPMYGPVFIAQERGYFAAEGLAADLVFFESAEPAAVAVVSDDIDFGVSGTSGGLYSLAGQGALRIIAAGAHETPGFQFFTLVASNRAWDAGLKSYADLPGHAVAVSQIGSPSHYSLALIEEKYGLDPKTIRVLPLQSMANQISAVIGGQAESSILNASGVMPVVQRGAVKLVGFVGDETPWQVGAVYTATRTADARGDFVARFLSAYRKGAKDYHDAFTGARGERRDGSGAPDIIAILAKYTGQPAATVDRSIAYVDGEARLDEADIRHQIAWYTKQGMVKGQIDPAAVIDRRYAVALPER